MKVLFGSNTVFFWARGVLLHGIFAYYDDDSLFLYCKFKGSSNSDIYYTWQVLSTHLGPYKALNPNTWNNNNYNSRKWKLKNPAMTFGLLLLHLLWTPPVETSSSTCTGSHNQHMARASWAILFNAVQWGPPGMDLMVLWLVALTFGAKTPPSSDDA